MKKLQVGLVVEGNSTSSTLLRLPEVAAELGPIKSLSLQVARRVSNFLKSGYAVTSYKELAAARTILIRVPDESVERVVADICVAGLTWEEHSFILCETWSPTEALEPLRRQGALTASVVALPSTQETTFFVEGDLPAVRQVRRLIERADARTIELRTGTKHLLFAATILCTAVPIPVLLLAQQALRESGVSGNQLSGVIHEMTSEMIARFQKGARMTWGGPLAESLESSQSLYWQKLDDNHVELSIALRSLVNWSKEQMTKR